VSRPDHAQVGVDFAPPRRPNRFRGPLVALMLVVALGGISAAVTQLLLR